jgi:hypothetical protein
LRVARGSRSRTQLLEQEILEMILLIILLIIQQLLQTITLLVHRHLLRNNIIGYTYRVLYRLAVDRFLLLLESCDTDLSFTGIIIRHHHT